MNILKKSLDIDSPEAFSRVPRPHPPSPPATAAADPVLCRMTESIGKKLPGIASPYTRDDVAATTANSTTAASGGGGTRSVSSKRNRENERDGGGGEWANASALFLDVASELAGIRATIRSGSTSR